MLRLSLTYSCPLTDKELLEELEKGLSDIEWLHEDSESEEEVMQLPRRVGDPNPDPQELLDADNKNELAEDDDDLELNVEEGIFEYKYTKKQDVKWLTNVQYVTREVSGHNNKRYQNLADERIPITYFEEYVPQNLYKRFAICTNVYANEHEKKKWLPTSVQEVRSLIGLHIITGCIKLPRLRMYWDSALHMKIFPESMSINRFFKLRTNLHCVNNVDDHNPNDKMWKVRPIYNAVLKRCKQLDVETHICVDEQIMPFKGKSAVKQYIKGKPHPWGIKLFLLCGASGLVYNFLIYQGQTTEVDEQTQKMFGQGSAVVLKLVEELPQVQYKLFFDNYFCSYNLLQILNEKSILAAGTVRINRFRNPPIIADKEMKKKPRGTSEEIISRDGIVFVKWLDNKPVVLASNYVGIGKSDRVKRWDRTAKNYVDVDRPEIVKEYNASMGGVDKADFLISIYRTKIRSKKWTLRMIFHAIDLATVNAWFEYKKDMKEAGEPSKNIMDLLHFKLRLGESLVKMGVSNKRKRGRPSAESPYNEQNNKKQKNTKEILPQPEIQRDNTDHLPIHTPGIPQRCKNRKCGAGKNGKSRWKCMKCQVHLCLNDKNNCFISFHQ